MVREANSVEVDMVPLIDVVTLLLMFLIIVGDMTKSATGVKMKLPRASQAREMDLPTAGRLVVQLDKDRNNQYVATIEGHHFSLVPRNEQGSLENYLLALKTSRIQSGHAEVDKDGVVSFPVKLRVPSDAPMTQVERIMTTLSKVGIANIHYAAARNPVQ